MAVSPALAKETSITSAKEHTRQSVVQSAEKISKKALTNFVLQSQLSRAVEGRQILPEYFQISDYFTRDLSRFQVDES